MSGGGLGSPGRRLYPNLSVADNGDLADVLVLSDDSFLCVLSDRLRCTLPLPFPLLLPFSVRRGGRVDFSTSPGCRGDGDDGLAEDGRDGPA